MPDGVADPAGTVAFAISINNAGEVTVAQYLSLEHPIRAPRTTRRSISATVQAVVTVTDGDGDVATQNVAIGNAIQFQDDGPTAAIVATGASVVLDESLGVDALDPNAATDDNVAGNLFPVGVWHADRAAVERRPGEHHDDDGRGQRGRDDGRDAGDCRRRERHRFSGCRRRTTGRSRCSTRAA